MRFIISDLLMRILRRSIKLYTIPALTSQLESRSHGVLKRPTGPSSFPKRISFLKSKHSIVIQFYPMIIPKWQHQVDSKDLVPFISEL